MINKVKKKIVKKLVIRLKINKNEQKEFCKSWREQVEDLSANISNVTIKRNSLEAKMWEDEWNERRWGCCDQVDGMVLIDRGEKIIKHFDDHPLEGATIGHSTPKEKINLLK